MKISVSWLRDFVDVPSEIPELKRVLRSIGLGVESVTSEGDDCVLDLEVTTNRPDCLCHYGVAREISTARRVPLKKVEVIFKESSAPAADAVSVEIETTELCPRYCARVIRNVQVKPTPEWLASRLGSMGARSINNVADITNYVLMELGQPLHAFDLDCLREHRIVVRRARPGEALTTLDGIQRKLNPENLVIADGQRPVALAGIMGGADTEITNATTSVLLESAWFDPLSIRRSSKQLRMHTEASHRFERGADIEMAPLALDRAAALIKEIAGGEILRGLMDVYPRPRRREMMTLRRSEIRRILGADVLWEDVERILRSLGFAVARRGPEAWAVTPPSFRLDVTREVDLIEEVARHYGYDRLPSRLAPAPPRVGRNLRRERELALTQTLVSLGYREIVSSSIVDPAEGVRFTDAAPVCIENPLSQEASALRTSTAPSMLRALRWNLDRGVEDLRLFEMGTIYRRNNEGSATEHRVLTLGLTGRRRPVAVHEPAPELDFFDLKGDVQTLLSLFEMESLAFATPGAATKNDDSDIGRNEAGWVDANGMRYLEPGYSAAYLCGTGVVATFGRLARQIQAIYELRYPVWFGEIDLEFLLGHPLTAKSFHPFSKFPSVVRDLSLVVPLGVSYDRIAQAMGQTALPELRSFRAVDLFSGGAVEPGHYSLLLRITFEAQDRTLTGEEIAHATEAVLNALAPLGIRLRGQPSADA